MKQGNEAAAHINCTVKLEANFLNACIYNMHANCIIMNIYTYIVMILYKSSTCISCICIYSQIYLTWLTGIRLLVEGGSIIDPYIFGTEAFRYWS